MKSVSRRSDRRALIAVIVGLLANFLVARWLGQPEGVIVGVLCAVVVWLVTGLGGEGSGGRSDGAGG